MSAVERVEASGLPVVGGRWSSYRTSHVVGRVESGTGRWVPACDAPLDRYLLVAHGCVGTPAGPSKVSDDECEWCAKGVRR